MSFRDQAKALVGKTVEVHTLGSSIFKGRLLSVGNDFLVMRVRIRRVIRRIIIPLIAISAFFRIFGFVI